MIKLPIHFHKFYCYYTHSMESIEHKDNLTHRAKTSQLFKRIDLNLSRRDSRSSKESRVFNRSMSKLSMSKTTANF